MINSAADFGLVQVIALIYMPMPLPDLKSSIVQIGSTRFTVGILKPASLQCAVLRVFGIEQHHMLITACT